MKPDLDKIDDAVLALFYFASFTEGKGPLAVTLAWKSHDWVRVRPPHTMPFPRFATERVTSALKDKSLHP
jgi:hypothetical protein